MLRAHKECGFASSLESDQLPFPCSSTPEIKGTLRRYACKCGAARCQKGPKIEQVSLSKPQDPRARYLAVKQGLSNSQTANNKSKLGPKTKGLQASTLKLHSRRDCWLALVSRSGQLAEAVFRFAEVRRGLAHCGGSMLGCLYYSFGYSILGALVFGNSQGASRMLVLHEVKCCEGCP